MKVVAEELSLGILPCFAYWTLRNVQVYHPFQEWAVELAGCACVQHQNGSPATRRFQFALFAKNLVVENVSHCQEVTGS